MSEKLVPIESENQKKRVVRWTFFLLLFIGSFVDRISQCYFFDSDIGGFHYGPGHP
jgi:hypothetical protein